MAFAEMVKNREWEKIFDILDQGTIEQIFNPNSWVKKLSYLISDCLKTISGHFEGIHGRFVLAESCIGSILKDKLGVLTKEEFEESLKQKGFEENDLDTKRNGSFFVGILLGKIETNI